MENGSSCLKKWGGYALITEGFVVWAHEVAQSEISDYKFYCFNGTPMYCQVIRDRNYNETIDFFDMNWNRQGFTGLEKPYKPHCKKDIPCPADFEVMKNIVRNLSKDLPFGRVDLYEINNRVYFGEITFYPGSGMGEFDDEHINIELGNRIAI